jgi:hypothetical protein
MRQAFRWMVGTMLLALVPAVVHAADQSATRAAADSTLILARADSIARPREAIAPTLPSPRVRAWQTGLLRADRLQHMSFALASGLSVGLLTREPVAALSGAMVLGVIKEVWDIRTTGFDLVDLGADAVGAGAATLVTSGLLR